MTTTGECKQGMDINHKSEWGYHPLLISLANTREPLYLLNRSGKRPSHEGAAAYLTAPSNYVVVPAFAASACGATPIFRRPCIWTAGTTMV